MQRKVVTNKWIKSYIYTRDLKYVAKAPEQTHVATRWKVWKLVWSVHFIDV